MALVRLLREHDATHTVEGTGVKIKKLILKPASAFVIPGRAQINPRSWDKLGRDYLVFDLTDEQCALAGKHGLKVVGA